MRTCVVTRRCGPSGSRPAAAVAALPVLLLAGGCIMPPPTSVVFPHPDPVPAAGGEIVAGIFGGGGFPFGYGGGGLSYAARIGDLGLSFSAWGAGGETWSEHTTAGAIAAGHLELAIPVCGEAGSVCGGAEVGTLDPPAARGDRPCRPGDRVHLLLGAGVSLSVQPGYSEFGVVHDARLRGIEPQLSLGVSGTPEDGETGGFWGVRGGTGLAFDTISGHPVGGLLYIAIGGGWRFGGDRTFFDLQIEPYGMVPVYRGVPYIPGAGLQLTMSLAFEVEQ